MKVLARRNHIVWVNYHGSRRPSASVPDARAIAGKLRRFIQGPRRISENMTAVTPLVVPAPGNRAVSALNRRLLTGQIRRILRGLPERPVQLWSFAPDVDCLVGQFEEECAVYYCVDEFAEFSGYDRGAILEAERRLCGRADVVVTTSQALFEAKRGFNENTILVTHGVDVEHFAKSSGPVPEDVGRLPRPIFGFWGLIQDWVDVDLLSKLAAKRRDWSFVLIGETVTDVIALRGLNNVHLLGRRPYEQLPRYAAAFDAGIIPFKVNALTRAVNPIKLREYLSAGLAVVSAPLPEVERYRELVEIADGVEAWAAACERALRRRRAEDAAARVSAMRGETWEGKVEEIARFMSGRATRVEMAKGDGAAGGGIENE